MVDDARLLCLETSSSYCSVALTINGEVFTLKSEKTQNHAEVLMGMIQDVCTKANCRLNSLNALAISDGPGSYTGLRIGSSSAKGICFALGIPLIAISTLKSLAYCTLKSTDADYIWPMIDARRQEVYHTMFNRQMEPLFPVKNGIVTEQGFLPESWANRSILICGDGAEKAGVALGLPYMVNYPEAKDLIELALEAYHKFEFVDLQGYEPFYLKSANITSPGS